MTLGIPDPMAMWHWVNDMNSGCGKIEDFPGIGFKPPTQMLNFQGGGPCIYSPSMPSPGRQINPDFDTSLFSRYGVILTVECSNTTLGKWRSGGRIEKLIEAFDLIDRKLRTSTSLNFREVFGGLEIRLAVRDVGGEAKATNAGLIEVSGPNHVIFVDNIIHELGHIIEQRTQQSGGNGMAAVASIPTTPRPDDTWIVPVNETAAALGPARGAGPLGNLEDIADIFMFWVMDSWIVERTSAEYAVAIGYIEGTGTGGIQTRGQTYTSPGMSFWAEEAKQYFADPMTLQLTFLAGADQFLTSGP